MISCCRHRLQVSEWPQVLASAPVGVKARDRRVVWGECVGSCEKQAPPPRRLPQQLGCLLLPAASTCPLAPILASILLRAGLGTSATLIGV